MYSEFILYITLSLNQRDIVFLTLLFLKHNLGLYVKSATSEPVITMTTLLAFLCLSLFLSFSLSLYLSHHLSFPQSWINTNISPFSFGSSWLLRSPETNDINTNFSASDSAHVFVHFERSHCTCMWIETHSQVVKEWWACFRSVCMLSLVCIVSVHEAASQCCGPGQERIWKAWVTLPDFLPFHLAEVTLYFCLYILRIWVCLSCMWLPKSPL